MADPARLDALRRQFAENPRRYFAPLASALRRAGDAQAAATLTRAQLAEQPEHLTGHVILGQALADVGDRDGARLAFERAHAVDPGNTVALESLVALARHAGDGRAAAHWVARLREADPEHAVAEAPPADAFEPFELDAFGADDREAFDAGTLEPGGEVFEPHALAAEAAGAAPPDGTVPGAAVPNGVPPNATTRNGTPFGGVPPGVAPLDDLRDDLLDPVVGLDVPPSDPVPSPMREALPELLAAETGNGPPPPPPAAPFVTETMAGLLLAQGHAAQALDVYVQLLAHRPDDERLRARVAALRAEAPAPVEASAANESDERAARMWRAAFAALPAEPSAANTLAPPDVAATSDAIPSPATPDVPAPDHAFEMFGDESGPAVPELAGDFERWAARVDRAAASADLADVPSVSQTVDGREPAAVPAPPLATAHPPADDPDEDLAHFNAWLRGLDE